MPLLQAILQNKIDIVRFLIDNGADPSEYENIFDATVQNGDPSLLELIIDRVNVDAEKASKLFLGILHAKNSDELLESTLRALDKKGGLGQKFPNILQEGLERGTTSQARILLKYFSGCILPLGRTTLHVISERGLIDLLDLVAGDTREMVNKADDSGLTPLHLTRSAEMASRLIDLGANPNAVDKKGDTPLHMAANVEVAKALIAGGASLNITNAQGYMPHQMPSTTNVFNFLREVRNSSANIQPPVAQDATRIPWKDRFTTANVTVSDLSPVSQGPCLFNISHDGTEYTVTERFMTSLARKMKFSSNIFNYFSPEEVFGRVAERAPNVPLKVTFDQETKEILGVVDEHKKILPPHIACQVFSDDDRLTHLVYKQGELRAIFKLEETFSIVGDSDYIEQLYLQYPVDGLAQPVIHLGCLRSVCNNGSVIFSSDFSTDIVVNDEGGIHLSRLLRSYNNQNGFALLEERLQMAQITEASIAELMRIEDVIAKQTLSNTLRTSIVNRLEQMAGDPCRHYGITSLTNIPAKRHALLPAGCTVNELFTFCSELTTHHPTVFSSVEPFQRVVGKMISQEYDLEGLYPVHREAIAFHFDKNFFRSSDEDSSRVLEIAHA